MKVANRQGQMKVDLAPCLACEMVIGQDWPPLYNVLEQVRAAEWEHKRQPIIDWWLGEVGEGLSEEMEEIVDLEGVVNRLQFREVQEEEEECHRIHEQEVAWIEEEEVRPELNECDPLYKVKYGLLY